MLLWGLLALPGWTASASDDDDKSGNSQQQAPLDTAGLKTGCFYARDVSNFTPLNRSYLLIEAPSKSRSYLLYISPPSVELRSTDVIAFEGRDRICGRPGERLLIGRGAGIGRNYTVMDSWQLDKVTAEQLLENKKARDNPVVTPDPDSPGAEVETEILPNREDE